MSADVLTFAPRPASVLQPDIKAASVFGMAAIWHLGHACNPAATSHEWHTDRAIYYVQRALHFARYALAGGGR